MRTKTKSRPRTKAPEKRRGDLMSAARKLFLKQGVEPTTIDQITSGADVAKGTFYLYFSSKEDVLTALREHFAQHMLKAIETAVASRQDNDWKGKLAAWAAAAIDVYIESIRLHDVLFYGSRPPARNGLVDNVIVDHLAALLAAGQDARAWSIGDAHFTSVFLFNGLHGIVEAGYTAEKGVNRREITRAVQQLCLKAVGIAS